jgi:hypothetical protein
MFSWIKNHPPLTAILLIAVITVWVSSNINWASHRAPRIIKVDGNGYYAYLPAIFIYKDLHFGFFEEIASRDRYQNMGYDYRYTYEGNVVNRYFAGTALAQLPFFLAAHGLSFLFGLPADGYSYLYLLFINLASLFYLLLGCWFIDKTLSSFSISPGNRALVLLCMVFGTNLFYYAVFEPSMSHIYSFAFVAAFASLIRSYFIEGKRACVLLAAMSLGIITLIRPVNVLVVALIPFLAGDRRTLRRGMADFLRNGPTLYLSLLVFLLVVSVQPVIYRIQTGHWFVYAYGDDGFDFLHPHFIAILFSYKKGLFVYTPLALLALAAGLYHFLGKRDLFKAGWGLVFFIMVTYVLSSWSQWYYGGSFSSRVYVEYYPFFALLLGTGLEGTTKPRIKGAVTVMMALLVIICVIQTYQYYFGHIHWSDMDRQKYWDVFLRVDRFF